MPSAPQSATSAAPRAPAIRRVGLSSVTSTYRSSPTSVIRERRIWTNASVPGARKSAKAFGETRTSRRAPSANFNESASPSAVSRAPPTVTIPTPQPPESLGGAAIPSVHAGSAT
jgi:hypothetical protein